MHSVHSNVPTLVLNRQALIKKHMKEKNYLPYNAYLLYFFSEKSKPYSVHCFKQTGPYDPNPYERKLCTYPTILTRWFFLEKTKQYSVHCNLLVAVLNRQDLGNWKEKLCIYVTILTHWFFLRKKLNHFLRKKLYSEHSNVAAVVLYRLDLMIQTLMNEKLCTYLTILICCFFFLRKN